MIVLIDNYDSFTHNLYQYLSQLTDEEVRVVRNDRITVGGIAALDPSRIVISPGPGRPEDAGVSVAAIRYFAGTVPILGVCLGHQAIGEAFGARIVAARAIVHGKTDRISVDGRGVFRSINSPSEFARYHSLAIAEETLPAELEVSARSADGEIMGVRHKEWAVEGVQFHPESIASDDGMKLLANFLNYRREPFEPRKYLERIIDGAALSQAEAAEFMEELTDGNLSDAQIAAFLVAFNAKGIEAAEIAGCAQVLQRKRTPLVLAGSDGGGAGSAGGSSGARNGGAGSAQGSGRARHHAHPLLDTCGTGGDGLGTYNISSLTALLAASCGARVAKHGNRAVSSRSGSADFYSALGIKIDIPPERAARSIAEANFAFLFAPVYHGAMRFAGPARRQLGIKTIMNLLGPLANPASADFQLIGVFSERYQRTVAEAAVRLGVTAGMVVHGLDGQDEISVTAPTRVVQFRVADAADDDSGEGDPDSPEARLGRATFDEFLIEPESYGLALHSPAALVGGTADENARVALRLLSGENGQGPEGVVDPALAALHDAVVLNTAAALNLYGLVQTIGDGVELAIRAIEEGRAMKTLEQVIAITNDDGVARAG